MALLLITCMSVCPDLSTWPSQSFFSSSFLGALAPRIFSGYMGVLGLSQVSLQYSLTFSCLHNFVINNGNISIGDPLALQCRSSENSKPLIFNQILSIKQATILAYVIGIFFKFFIGETRLQMIDNQIWSSTVKSLISILFQWWPGEPPFLDIGALLTSFRVQNLCLGRLACRHYPTHRLH